VDFSSDFGFPNRGFINYLYFKLQLTLSTLVELIGLLAIIKTVSALFQRSVIDIFNLSRRNNLLIFNISQVSKLYVFSLLLVVPNFLGSHFRVPFMTATLSAYQFCYLYLKHSRYYYKFLSCLVINTYIYFLYLRVYPFLSNYRFLLHLMYTLSLAYQLLHNLNRFSFQFESLMMALEEDPMAFDRIVTMNLRRSLVQRV
jgi:hypothetical protein